MPTQPLGWSRKGEIKSPNDLRGVKYRTVGLSADLFKKDEQKVRVVRTPRAVLEAQLKAWDAVIAEKGKDNPFWQRVVESQKQWAQRTIPWKQDIYVDAAPAFDHFFKRKS